MAAYRLIRSLGKEKHPYNTHLPDWASDRANIDAQSYVPYPELTFFLSIIPQASEH